MVKVTEGIAEQNWATPYDIAKDTGIVLIEAYKKLQEIRKTNQDMDLWFDEIGVDRNTIATLVASVVEETQKKYGIGSYGVIREGIKWGFDSLDSRNEEETIKAFEKAFEENLFAEFGKRSLGKRVRSPKEK